MINELVKGDATCFTATVGVDVTGWKFRCEIWDESDNSIKKASTAAGGSDAEIKVITIATGEIEVYITSGETSNFDEVANIEIEGETDLGDKYTVLQDALVLSEKRISWSTPD